MDPMTLTMATIGVLNAIDQSQRAKNQQGAEIAKMRFGPWTGMQGGVVPLPNAPIMEGIGGVFKGMEYADAAKDRDMQREYLGKRMAYLEKQQDAETWKNMDKALRVKEIGAA